MKKIVLFLFATAACMPLLAQTSYEKVVSAPADWAGNYLIVCEGEGVVFNGAADEASIDAKGGAAILSGIGFSDGVLAGTSALDAAVFSIVATDDANWPWALQSASGLYLGHKDSTVVDNGLSTETSIKKKCKHTLEIDAQGNFIATPQWSLGQAFNLQYNKKADQQRFRYFLPDDKQAIQLYKQTGATTGLEQQDLAPTCVKRIENGQVVIIRNGKKYTILGKAL